jgi:hypothetical protein
MATVIASGKRFGLILFSVLTLGQTTATAPVLRWAASWWLNRSSIIVLASVNTAITTASELVSRELLAQGSNNSDQRFFIKHDDGRLTVHRQSLVNIFMTIFASLLGGPIYFIRKRWNRFMFFISFGAMNSASSQMLAHLAYDGTIALSLGRFAFDLFYNGTLKFWMFEFARPAILRFRKSLVGIGSIRVTQDFLTTLFRVGMLNWFGFK